MTVSPKRPQDGTLQQIAGGNGVESDDRSSHTSLPPTLFKLPNLDAGARMEAATREADAKFPHSEFLASENAGSKETLDRPVAQEQIDTIDRLRSPYQTDVLGDQETSETVSRDSVFDSEFSNSELQETHRTGSSTSDESQRQSIDPGAEAAAKAFEATFTALAQSELRDNEFRDTGREAGSGVLDSDLGPEVPPSRSSDSFAESTMSQDDHPRIPGPPAVANSTRTPATSTTRSRDLAQSRRNSGAASSMRDAPVGRSWMESLGSHGVVIVLLLVVVAAALLTGRGEEDPDSKSLSTQSELLNFDELDVDLPMPAQESMPTFAEATTAPDADMVELQDVEDSSSVLPTLTDLLPSEAAGVAAAPVVSLEQPEPATSLPSASGEDLSIGLVDNGIQVNQFVDPRPGTNARTVSDRVDAPQRDSSLPSLEELAGLAEPVTSPAPPAQSSTAPMRTVTKTPAAIDWTKYLQPLPNTAEVPAAGNSSSSN